MSCSVIERYSLFEEPVASSSILTMEAAGSLNVGTIQPEFMGSHPKGNKLQ
jgi:hypothetical protein